jgi:hypothetical protein
VYRRDAEGIPVVKPGLVAAVTGVAIVVAALVGCCSKPSTATTATTNPNSSTASQQVGSSTGTTSSSAVVPATGEVGDDFVGHWNVHGASLDIAPTKAPTTATIVDSLGPCSPGAQRFCHETDTLTVVSGDATQVTLQVTAVSYADDTGAGVPNPDVGASTAVGDSMRLVMQAPGLLKAAILNGFPGWVGGNPYWCGPGISQADRQLCGA